MLKNNFSSIESIIKAAKQGKMFILVDDEKRENEGDLVYAAALSTPQKVILMITKNILFSKKYTVCHT